MKGKRCPYGEYLDRPIPNSCQHETGYCHGCQIYLDWHERMRVEFEAKVKGSENWSIRRRAELLIFPFTEMREWMARRLKRSKGRVKEGNCE